MPSSVKNDPKNHPVKNQFFIFEHFKPQATTLQGSKMTEPCTKADVIERIDSKLDQLIDLQIDNGKIHEKLFTQDGRIADHENRIRKIEGVPLRALWWLLGIGGTIIAGWVVHVMMQGV